MIKSVARATSDASSPPRKRAAGKRVPVKQTKAKQSNAKKSLKEAKKDTIRTSKKTSGRKRMTAKKNSSPEVTTVSATNKSKIVSKRYSLRSNA